MVKLPRKIAKILVYSVAKQAKKVPKAQGFATTY
jgi:hypothetical protein